MKYVSVNYYWYHHGLVLDKAGVLIVEDITEAIEKKDFKTFKKWAEKLNTADVTFLPDTAIAYDEEENEYEINIMSEENFSLITDNEYEHG